MCGSLPPEDISLYSSTGTTASAIQKRIRQLLLTPHWNFMSQQIGTIYLWLFTVKLCTVLQFFSWTIVGIQHSSRSCSSHIVRLWLMGELWLCGVGTWPSHTAKRIRVSLSISSESQAWECPSSVSVYHSHVVHVEGDTNVYKIKGGFQAEIVTGFQTDMNLIWRSQCRPLSRTEWSQRWHLEAELC